MRAAIATDKKRITPPVRANHALTHYTRKHPTGAGFIKAKGLFRDEERLARAKLMAM
jgi:hypothetical protein